MRISPRALSVLALVASMAACRPSESEQATTAAETPATVVDVRAGDYFFEAPDSIEAGTVTFRLHNAGPELHHIQLVRLDDGRTMQDILALSPEAPPPSWVRNVGGPNTPVPSGVSEATVTLQPGRYAILCVIPSPDGTPHMMKGMHRELTVTAASAPAAPLPHADAVMVLDDYSFTTTPEISAGRRTIRVENRASQPHEVVIAQLAPGKTVQDLLHWLENPEGPPPGRPLGGTTAFDQGEINQVTIDFDAGEVGLICFIPDANDGRPHFLHGMIQQITVR